MHKLTPKIVKNNSKVAQIPLQLLHDKTLTISEKSLLILLNGLKYNGYVPRESFLMRWVERKKFINYETKLPKQLADTLKSVAEKKHIMCVYEGKRLMGVKVINQYSNRVVNIHRDIFKNLNIKLNELLVATIFASQGQNFNICTKFASKRYGMSRTTFLKYTRSLEDKQIIQNKRLNERYKIGSSVITNLSSKPVNKPVNLWRSIWSHSIYKDYIYISNINKRVLSMKDLNIETYLNSENRLYVVKSIAMYLHQNGLRKTDNEINEFLENYILDKRRIKNNDITFKSAYQYAVYLAKAMCNIGIDTKLSFKDLACRENLLCSAIESATPEKGEYGLAYVRWKLKNLENTEELSFRNENNFISFVVELLKRDYRKPNSTMDWDEDYDSEFLDRIESKHRRASLPEVDRAPMSIGSLLTKIRKV